MKDPLLGKKRLASMPDRVTNTINTCVRSRDVRSRDVARHRARPAPRATAKTPLLSIYTTTTQ